MKVMTPDELRIVMERIWPELTLTQAAGLEVGVEPRSVQRWAAGEREIPMAVAVVLGAVAGEHSPAWLSGARATTR